MPPSSLPTPPVLLLAWRRPHTTRQVIEALRPAAPQRLYVACDGPNPTRPGEAEKVAETRAVIEAAVDWPCRLERRYSEGNQGCRLGVSGAISWFFEQEEEGIILEDDLAEQFPQALPLDLLAPEVLRAYLARAERIAAEPDAHTALIADQQVVN